jgi:hypothetical protein
VFKSRNAISDPTASCLTTKISKKVVEVAKMVGYFEEIGCRMCSSCITEENGVPYLNALYKGKKTICERVLKLDAERYQKGNLPLSNLLSKYCSYMVISNRE